MAEVLRGTRAPSPEDVFLLDVLDAVARGHKVLEKESGGVSRKEFKARVDDREATVDVPGHVDEAIRKAIASINAVIIVAVVAATAVT